MRRLHLHSAFFDHSTDVVQVITKASHRQAEHLDLCLRPLCPLDKDRANVTTNKPHFLHHYPQTETPDLGQWLQKLLQSYDFY